MKNCFKSTFSNSSILNFGDLSWTFYIKKCTPNTTENCVHASLEKNQSHTSEDYSDCNWRIDLILLKNKETDPQKYETDPIFGVYGVHFFKTSWLFVCISILKENYVWYIIDKIILYKDSWIKSILWNFSCKLTLLLSDLWFLVTWHCIWVICQQQE